jgi:periplasmic divalent cation tolerance protein
MDAMLVITNMPDRDKAEALARKLVDSRLAACVNIMAECDSIYVWEGKTESAREVPLLIKTQSRLYRSVEAAILDDHPYELPEIVAVSFSDGSPEYLRWIASQTL